MGRACSIRHRWEMHTQFYSENMKRIKPTWVLGIDGSTILKLILKEKCVKGALDSSASPMLGGGGCCEHSTSLLHWIFCLFVHLLIVFFCRRGVDNLSQEWNMELVPWLKGQNLSFKYADFIQQGETSLFTFILHGIFFLFSSSWRPSSACFVNILLQK